MTLRKGLAILLGAAGLAAAAMAAVAWWPPRGPGAADALEDAARPPAIRPEYGGATIPPNIAPLNFIVDEPADAYSACLRGEAGERLEVVSRSPAICWPIAAWRKVLEANRGRQVKIEVFARYDGRWRRFAPLALDVARESIDPCLVYRLIRPIYNLFYDVGIYQRDLEGYDQTPIAINTDFDRGCINCHTFPGGDPSRMLLQVRGPPGAAMILARGSTVRKIDTRIGPGGRPATYISWHPDKRRVAFSVNKISIFFHALGENRDVFDADSDLGIYDIEANTLAAVPGLADPDRLETWPAWSADGRFLYFSSAPKLPKERFREVRYDLMRIAYDPATGAWSRPETVLAAEGLGSLSEPRPSPNGRWILVTVSEYGSFPIHQASADLLLVDAATRQARRLECNSGRCDSYHSWSSNSRWIVFSSKRWDGVFARPFFAYVDEAGVARKPFVLPQQDPTYYESCILTYNAPELVRGHVPVSRMPLGRVIRAPEPDEALKAALDPASPAAPFAPRSPEGPARPEGAMTESIP